MKKKILMALSLVSVAALSIGGTVAYLTDKEESTQTYTAGNVDIVLVENEDADTNKLVPGVKVTPNTQIENKGTEAAYVWLEVGMPVTVGDESGDASKNIIHWNVPGAYWNGYHTNEKYWVNGQTEAVADEDTWIVDTVTRKIETIEGVEYAFYTLKYKGAIEAGETTNVGISTVYIDAHIDYLEADDTDSGYTGWAWVQDGAVTEIEQDLGAGVPFVVRAYGIQAKDYADVDAAYAAYNNQWS